MARPLGRVDDGWKASHPSCMDFMMPSIGKGMKAGNGARGIAPGARLEGIGVSVVGIVLPVPGLWPLRLE